MTDPTPLSSLSSALADVVARIAPSVVSVHSHRSRATGFVWKPGLIVTADEALADEGEVADRPPRRQHGRRHDRRPRPHDRHRAAARRCRSSRRSSWPRRSRRSARLSVVVATDRDAPSAALGMVSVVRQELAQPARRRHRCTDRARRAPAFRPARRACARCIRRSLRHGRARTAAGAGDPGGNDRARRGPARDTRPHRPWISRPRPAAGAARRRHRRDGDECRQGRSVGCGRHSPGRRDRGGQRPETLRRARAVATLGPASVGAVVDVAARRGGEPVSFKVTVGERPEA